MAIRPSTGIWSDKLFLYRHSEDLQQRGQDHPSIVFDKIFINETNIAAFMDLKSGIAFRLAQLLVNNGPGRPCRCNRRSWTSWVSRGHKAITVKGKERGASRPAMQSHCVMRQIISAK
jgi:hypothetical protein